MKKKLSTYLKPALVSFLTILFLWGCLDTKVSEPAAGISVEEAKQWFTSKYLRNANSRQNAESDVYRKVYWDNAFKYNYEGLKAESEIVVVPIVYARADAPSGFKQLWIYKNSTGETIHRIVEYVYDDSEKTRFKSFKKFSGLMIFRDWDDNFLGGLVLKNNKFVAGISDLQSGTPEKGYVKKKNAREGYYVCGNNTHCVPSYTYVVGYGEGYWHMDCIDIYECVWVDVIGTSPPPTTAPYYPPSSGGSSSTGDFSFKTEFIHSACTGMAKMLSIQAHEGREVAGFITQDDNIVIAPTNGHTWYTSAIRQSYVDVNNNTILVFFAENGKWYVQASPAFGNWKYEVKATIHTHPPGPDRNIPSPLDNAMAASYNNEQATHGTYQLNHFFINFTHIGQFNSSGLVNLTPNQCTIYVGNYP